MFKTIAVSIILLSIIKINAEEEEKEPEVIKDELV